MRYQRRYGIVAFFILALAFFWYQHSCALYWDFLAYVLNARHLFGGSYFEWMRPPLIPLVMAPFTLFGIIGEYLFIAASLGFFTWASVHLAKTLNIREDVFLFFLIQPLLLIHGAREGSELLSGALFALFLSFLIKESYLSGAFLGLGIIARYNFIYFIPSLFFLKRKQWLLGLGLAVSPLACWMLINLIMTGNMFTSLADNIALNKIFRTTSQPVPWLMLLVLLWAPLTLVSFSLKKAWKRKDWIMVTTILIIIYVYLSIPLKVDRYLLFLIFPFSYFICKACSTKRMRIAAGTILLTASIIWFTAGGSICGDIRPAEIRTIAADLPGQVLSDGWVHLNYYGVEAFPKPSNEAMHYFLMSGRKAAILKQYFNEPEPKPEDGFPIIRNDEKVLVLGIEGIEGAPLPGDLSYLELRALDRRIAANEAFDPNPCYYVIRNPIFTEPCLWFHGEAGRKDYSNEVISQGDHPFAREFIDTVETFCDDIPNLPGSGIEKAIAQEKIAALGCGFNRAAALKEASDIWLDAGQWQRAMLIKNLSNDVRPFPMFNSTYYAHPNPKTRYCDIELCEFPVLAFQAEGVWYFPGGEGSYKYRIQNASV